MVKRAPHIENSDTRDGTKRDKEPREKDYYKEWLKCVVLLRKCFRANRIILGFTSAKDLEYIQKLNEEIEDVI